MGEVIVQRVETGVGGFGARMSWAAIWAGFIVATVAQLILSVLGIALGFSIWNPGAGGLGGIAMGAWIWFVVTAIISLFIGGMAMGRLTGVLTRWNTFLHSVVMWGLSAILAVWMITNGVGMLVGSTLNAVTQTAAAAVTGAVGATGSMASTAVRNPAAVQALRDSVRSLLDSLRARGGLPEAGTIRESAGEVASEAANKTAVAAWIALATIILSLAAAAWGAGLAARR